MAEFRNIEIPDFKEFNDPPHVAWNIKKYPTHRYGYNYKIILTTGQVKHEVCAVKDRREALPVANGLERTVKAIFKSLGSKAKVRCYVIEERDSRPKKYERREDLYTLRSYYYMDSEEKTRLDLMAEVLGLTSTTFSNIMVQLALERSVIAPEDYQLKRLKGLPDFKGIQRLKDFYNLLGWKQMGLAKIIVHRVKWLGEGATVRQAMEIVADGLKGGRLTTNKQNLIKLPASEFYRERNDKLKEIRSEKFNSKYQTDMDDMESEENEEDFED